MDDIDAINKELADSIVEDKAAAGDAAEEVTWHPMAAGGLAFPKPKPPGR